MALSLSTTRGRDEVTLVVDGREFRFFESLEVTLSLDTVSTVELTAPFEPGEASHRKLFLPFQFQPLEVLLGGENLFTGTVVSTEPSADANRSVVELAGYSLPGVLGDCAMPVDELPLEFKGIPLKEILPAITKPFGVDVEIRDDTGPAFKKVSIDIDDKPLEWLAKLARQRSLVLSSTDSGKLLCWRSVQTGSPVAALEGQPLVKVESEFSAQDYFSVVTGFVPKTRRRKGIRQPLQNPWLTGRVRPMNFRLDDIDPASAPDAVRAKLARMFAGMAAYSVKDLPTWRDPSGNLWRPNTTIKIKAPEVMIYDYYEFLIRTVRLREEADKQTADLELVMPGAFSGEIPESLPWQA